MIEAEEAQRRAEREVALAQIPADAYDISLETLGLSSRVHNHLAKAQVENLNEEYDQGNVVFNYDIGEKITDKEKLYQALKSNFRDNKSLRVTVAGEDNKLAKDLSSIVFNVPTGDPIEMLVVNHILT